MASLASLARAPVAQQSVAAAQRRQLASAPGFGASGQQRQRRQLVIVAGQGFGSTQQNAGPRVSNKKKQPKIARYLERDVAKEAAADDGDTDGWIEMPNVDVETTFVSKPIKPLILATGRAVCLFKVGDTVFASDANSTAYKYPLADANILNVKGKPAVEVPLDGTVYDLATGKVLSWCPKNTLARKVLGGLKDKSDPEDLPVYPVDLRGNKVFVRFVK
ncbi:hypothetical protein ACK3TF_003209 [Chlorella vulgaris]